MLAYIGVDVGGVAAAPALIIRNTVLRVLVNTDLLTVAFYYLVICELVEVDELYLLESPEKTYDLNHDGKISTADIQVLINEMKKAQEDQDMKYDLNRDGKVSTADIQVIINEMNK